MIGIVGPIVKRLFDIQIDLNLFRTYFEEFGRVTDVHPRTNLWTDAEQHIIGANANQAETKLGDLNTNVNHRRGDLPDP